MKFYIITRARWIESIVIMWPSQKWMKRKSFETQIMPMSIANSTDFEQMIF